MAKTKVKAKVIERKSTSIMDIHPRSITLKITWKSIIIREKNKRLSIIKSGLNKKNLKFFLKKINSRNL